MGFSLVAQSPSLRGECLGDRETAAMCLGDRAQGSILEPPKAYMPSCRYVLALPEDFRIERWHPSSPPFEPANGSLKLAVVHLKKDSMVLRTGDGWSYAVERREDDVPDASQFDRFDEIGAQVPLEPVPVAVVYADRRAIAV